jgi:Fur family transcriptional regulator, ferric uptake regulator
MMRRVFATASIVEKRSSTPVPTRSTAGAGTATQVPATPIPEGLRNSLHGRGQRLTPQRQRVLDLFRRIGEGSHLSAEEVHQRLLGEQTRVSLATVYRTLRLLSALELLRELELPEGGRRFELASDSHRDHHHLVCLNCGRTEEFDSTQVMAAGEAAATTHGFRLMECVLTVRALCPRCAAAAPL